MAEVATVTSKSMVNIPARIRRKYGLKQGAKVAFVETETAIILVPIPRLSELFGSGKAAREKLLEGVRELEAEHRREAPR